MARDDAAPGRSADDAATAADRPAMVIPADRLPAGFARDVERPPAHPSPPVPAATAVLVRDGPGVRRSRRAASIRLRSGAESPGRRDGPEVLLLRRHRSSGFVPGAYVFPGGRVDAADADDALFACVATSPPPEPDASYAMAAIREVFEETGVLIAAPVTDAPPPDATSDPALAEWREALLADRATLLDVVRATGRRLDAASLVYIAHWITPVAEPRRYDTRFFLAPLPHGCVACADAREMTDERWIRPEDALDAFRAGRLSMVFPTVRTLEQLSGYASVEALLRAFRGRPVATVQPRLVRTGEGVGIIIDS